MACLATSIPTCRRKATRQLVNANADAPRVGQLQKLPLGRVGPTAAAPVPDRPVAHAERTGNRVHAAKFVDQGHAANKDTICSVSQGRNVSCNAPGFRHDDDMAGIKSSEFDRLVGRRLAATRVALGLTQEEMADLLGCSRQAVSHYENGSRKMTPQMAVRIFTHHGISPEYYFLGLLRNESEKIKPILANPPEPMPMGRPKKAKPKADPKAKPKLKAAS